MKISEPLFNHTIGAFKIKNTIVEQSVPAVKNYTMISLDVHYCPKALKYVL